MVYYLLQPSRWQKGYGAFSISPSHVESVRECIAAPAKHHRHESFQDELRRLCKKYGVDP
ncbi:MAG: transposase [Caldithrix sp.]|nr:MAG: transposase [Caldithrix sp.]